MHTGYDNFWMHKNSRLKPVPNLPKNDNYSCALLPNNYKHMQSRGCPSQLSSFIPPQNNAASSYEKDHYRNSYDQSMWPSSVYSLPFMPSYANNLHPQESFFSHTNNFVYPSPNPQAQEKHDFRHLQMSNENVNTCTVHNTSTSTLANSGLARAQHNKNINTQIPRIRVKDVFTLNNKSVQGQLDLDGHFGVRQQKELLGSSAHYNRTLESQNQIQYTEYKNANFVESSKSSQFEHRTAKQTCLTNQEQFQSSCSFYLQKDDFSLGNFEFSGGRQIESSLSSESFQPSTPASLFSQFLTQESVPEGGLQNCQGKTGGRGNSQPRHEGVKARTMRNLIELHDPNYSDSNYSRSCGLNVLAPDNCTSLKNVNNVHCDPQENLSKINEVNLKSLNSASNIMSKNVPSITSKSPPLKEINNQQNDLIKIKTPHTDKSSFIRVNDCDDTERNSAVNLQSFFEQSDKNCVADRNTQNIIDEESGVVNSIPPPVGQSNFVSHHASPKAASIRDNSANESGTITHKNSVPAVSTSLISSPRNCQQDSISQRPRRQEFDVLSNKDGGFFQHSTKAPEIIQQKFAEEISGGNDSTPEQGIPTNDFTATPLTLKQESFHSEIESASLQRAKNPPEDKEFHPTIKTEENLTARECEPPDMVNEALPKFNAEDCSSTDKSRSDCAAVADSEDHADKVNTLKSSSSKREDVQKSEGKERERKVSPPKVNYKSNINRDKLDLLIQFLKKDQDSGGSSSCKERQSCRETPGNANSESHRSRRKLNKASIVKNKNNSREMISLMSPKSSTFTCKAPQITERSKNSEEIGAGKNSCSKDKLMAEESLDISKERMKRNNSCQNNESKRDDSWMTEPSNEAACLSKQQFQESSEKLVPKDMCPARNENAIISTVRAFQNSKTHFCVSCKLVSSVESFWINMVSGEVRCLNCFKRVSKAQTKENVLKSKSNDLHDSSMEPLLKRKIKTEKENKSRDSATVGGSNSWVEGERKQNSKCEEALRKLNGMKENVRQELLEMFVWKKPKSNERKETTNCLSHTRRGSSGDAVDSQKGKPSEEKVLKTEKSARTDISSEEVGKRFTEIGTHQGLKDVNATRKRKSSSEEEDFAKRERHPSSIKQGKTSIPKEQYSEGGAKEETVIKSEKSHGRRASRSEDGQENRAKKETKGVASSNTRRSSYDSGEEFRHHSVSIIEERGQKDLKVRHCTDESRKPLPKEGWPARKDHAAEEAAKRSARYEISDKSKTENIWREGHFQRSQSHHPEAKTSKLFPRRDPKAPDALARTTYNQNGIETQKRMESTEQMRKRKNSDEDFSPHKVHILQEFIKRGSVQATHPSKSPEPKASKEYDNPHRGVLWNARISAEKSGRSDASKEECVLFGEHLNKEAKPPPEREKAKVKHLCKGPVVSERTKPSEPAKGRATCSVEQPRRKSKDEERGPEKAVGWRRVSESSEGPRRKSWDEEPAVSRNTLRVNGEGKRENLAAENREKKKFEEKEGNRSWEKMAKVSPTSLYVLDAPGKDGQSRRPDGAWRLFREKQSTKTSAGAP